VRGVAYGDAASKLEAFIGTLSSMRRAVSVQKTCRTAMSRI
jgi:hypothetical protein